MYSAEFGASFQKHTTFTKLQQVVTQGLGSLFIWLGSEISYLVKFGNISYVDWLFFQAKGTVVG